MSDLKKYNTVTGEQISYRVYGDEGGFPILVHHGLLGSSLLPDSWSQKAKEIGVRLIAIDRPGYGETTMTSSLKVIADWGAFISPLLDFLKVESFDTIAVSAGAPYAWAEAWYFKSRLNKLWLLSAVPDVSDSNILDFYPEDEKLSYERFKERSVEQIAQDYYGSLKLLREQYMLSDGVSRRIEAALSNNCIGVAREAKMQVSPWGFGLDGIATPMEFWHSPKDDMVPIEAVEAMISGLKDAKLHLQEKKSHFPSVATVDEVFQSINRMF